MWKNVEYLCVVLGQILKRSWLVFAVVTEKDSGTGKKL
jgi:hypothetical protein